MLCRLFVLTLFALLPGMNVLAASAPQIYAILQIAPPPKGMTADQYLQNQIEGQTDHSTLARVWSYPEVRQMDSVANMKDGRPWLAKNLHVTEENSGRYLRFTFRAGSPIEQVVILNAFLRAKLANEAESIKSSEEAMRRTENDIIDFEKRNKKPADYLRNVWIPAARDGIARRKQFMVIRWAK